MSEKILIIDFGSQYTQLIARRVRELNVYCEIHPYHHLPDDYEGVKGIILSGGPRSVREPDAPDIDLSTFSEIPVLGICYGAQLIAARSGGEVQPSQTREFGKAVFQTNSLSDHLFENINTDSQVWMSHGDTITALPDDFNGIGATETVKIAAFKKKNASVYGIQFHPEVTHTEEGKLILQNFVIGICKCSPSWTPDAFVESTVASLKEELKNESVVIGLSGGVDSTVAAVLLDKAIKEKLHCIFVDNGLLRKNEFEEVLASYKHMGLNITGVDASEEFYKALKNVTDPEKKRKTIGRVFIEVFDREAHKITNVSYLAQGTIYPDVIESASVNGPTSVIKSHHNVGGLPEKMHLKVIEPLRSLFKDEVRKVGRALGIDRNLLSRHPFPGPGLGVRILGEVSKEKADLLREADHIFISSLKTKKLYDEIWQAGTVLLPIQSVGVMGDERTYEYTVALRAVTSVDGMTADWARLPNDFLADVSGKIINNVKGINRVVYDISSKPPATIEWE